MNESCAVCDFSPQLRSRIKCVLRIFLLEISVVVGSAGCLAPPILFPRTTASGVVLNQNGDPVPRAALRAYWHPLRLIPMTGPAYHEDFATDGDGLWEFHVRKVATWLQIEVVPTGGQLSDRQSVQIGSGQTRTNVVFILKHGADPSK